MGSPPDGPPRRTSPTLLFQFLPLTTKHYSLLQIILGFSHTLVLTYVIEKVMRLCTHNRFPLTGST
jgi:hypothetical protein